MLIINRSYIAGGKSFVEKTSWFIHLNLDDLSSLSVYGDEEAGYQVVASISLDDGTYRVDTLFETPEQSVAKSAYRRILDGIASDAKLVDLAELGSRLLGDIV